MVVSTLGAVEALRTTLKATIWPAGGYPTQRRAQVVASYSSSYFGKLENDPALENLATMYRFEVHQYLGVDVRPLHFQPTTARGPGFIFAIGHDGGPFTAQSRNVVNRLLRQGYHVVTVGMPLYFAEARPLIANIQLGLEHGDLAQYQYPNGWHPLAWFCEPTIAAINYLADLGVTTVYMIGYSGGGWCTHLMAALDTRISHSFPCTAGLPLDIRVGTENGDWEQYLADVFATPIADYRDLWVMAADRAGRSQLQIVNTYDPIFPDLGRAATYGPPITAIASGLGSSWGYWLDTFPTEHVIGDRAISRVFQHLGITLW